MTGRSTRGAHVEVSGSAGPLTPPVRLAAARFVADQQMARRRLYRMHLQASVKGMNRLAFDIAAESGDGPADVARRLRPAADWPWRALDGRAASAWRIAADALGHRSSALAARHYMKRRGGGRDRVPSVAGVADPRFIVVDACIEVEGRLGRGHVFTHGETASLEIPDSLPLSVLAALPGRRMSDLLDHPLVNGRDYVIESAGHAHWDAMLVTFSTGIAPVVLPWGRLLREAARG